MDRKLFVEYAKYEELKRHAEQAQTVLKPQILAIITEMGKPIEVSGIGTFSSVAKKIWTYSPQVQLLETDLKDVKKREEQDGTASFTENPYPQFRPFKDVEKTQNQNS